MRVRRLLYSRTRTEDYRWIYSISDVWEKGGDILREEYEKNEYNRSKEDTIKNILIYHTDNFIVMYKIIDAKTTDIYGRKIFGLSGYLFSGYDMEIVDCLLPYIIEYYRNNDAIFFDGLEKISDDDSEENVEINISLDDIIEKCRNWMLVNSASIYKELDKVRIGIINGKREFRATYNGRDVVIDTLLSNESKTNYNVEHVLIEEKHERDITRIFETKGGAAANETSYYSDAKDDEKNAEYNIAVEGTIIKNDEKKRGLFPSFFRGTSNS